MRPPEPIVDSLESPITLNATIFALIDRPVVRLNGDARSTSTGIEQVRCAMTVKLFIPSQLVGS